MMRSAYLLVLTAALACGCATTEQPSEAPSAPIGHSADEAMFQFVGTWEGTLDGYNGPHFIDGVGFPMKFRIVVTPTEVSVFNLVKGEWHEMKPGAFHGNYFGPHAIISSSTSGQDDDGTWVESSTFTLAHTDTDTVIAYWQRTVNNLDIPPDQQYYQFAWGNSGVMRRARDGG